MELLSLPLIVDAKEGKLKKDGPKTINALVQIRLGLIQPFRPWLLNGLGNVDTDSQAACFYSENAEEEKTHDRWWKIMAKAYGVGSEDYNVPMTPKMQALYDFLTACSLDKRPAVGLGTVNLSIETAAALLTAAVADGLRAQLRGTEYLWVKVHKKGDQIHSLRSRSLLKEYVGKDKNLQRLIVRRVIKTFDLFTAALREIYPA
jgi:pyrroloquinoline quinone (PQQ) biosynthesis protein C